MKKIAVCTDIHLNILVRGTPEDAGTRLAADSENADALIITGDISEGPTLYEHLSSFATGYQRALRRAGQNVPIYFVLGNHDYWFGGAMKAHRAAEKLTRANLGLTWLRKADVVTLDDRTALVGHDGFYDAGLGDGRGSSVVMNDFSANPDLRGLHRYSLVERLQEKGRKNAREAREALQAALVEYQRVIFATHVPPWREASWHEGRTSDVAHLPWYTNRAMGQMLEILAGEHPGRQIVVLCGHTHGSGTVQIMPNLVCHTGGAQYGGPAISRVINLGAELI